MTDVEGNSENSVPKVPPAGVSDYTPGPWTVWQLAPDSDPQERHIIVAGEYYGTEICGIVENVADAELMAAAPEMLEALKVTRDWLLQTTSPSDLERTPLRHIKSAIIATERR